MPSIESLSNSRSETFYAHNCGLEMCISPGQWRALAILFLASFWLAFTAKNLFSEIRHLLSCDESLLSTILLSCTDPPKILYYSRNLTVNESFETNLFCNASGNPSPRILWKLPNGSSLELANNEFLTFKNTSKHQQGRYSCEAFNRVGNSTFRAAVFLNVQCKYLKILLFSFKLH